VREIESIVIEQQAEEIKLLREELMVAVLHVCNYYHWDGHYKRVVEARLLDGAEYLKRIEEEEKKP